MPKYDDYEFDDLSLDEQKQFLSESKLATDDMRKRHEARRDQFVTLFQKRSQSNDDTTRDVYSKELRKLDPLNMNLSLEYLNFFYLH